MKRVALATLAVAGHLCLSISLRGQTVTGYGTSGGDLPPRITYAYEFGGSGPAAQPHHWIRSIVIWRGQPEWGEGSFERPLDSAATHAATTAWRLERFTAEDSGRTVIGGQRGTVVHTAEVSRDGSELRVLGHHLTVPERDSTLVVMVDRVDSVGGPPYIAGTAYVKLGTQDSFWPRSWTRGDTTFFVHPHDQNELLASELRKWPAVAEFLR